MADGKKNNPTLAILAVAIFVVLIAFAFLTMRGRHTPASGQLPMPTNGTPAASPAQPEPVTPGPNTGG